jgi:hypothetical protein
MQVSSPDQGKKKGLAVKVLELGLVPRTRAEKKRVSGKDIRVRVSFPNQGRKRGSEIKRKKSGLVSRIRAEKKN